LSPPVTFVPPLVPAFTVGRAADRMATVGKLEVHLKGGMVEAPEEGVAGWFANSFGMFRKQTESYSVREFLEKYSRFLSDRGLRNVLLIEIDYTMVYSDKKNENPDDLDPAIRSAYEYLIQHVTDSNKVVLSAVGKTNMGLRDDVQFSVEAQFYRRHGFGKPAVEIEVVGIPSVFVKQDKETKLDYEARLRQMTQELEDDTRRREVSRAHEEAMKIIMADYEQHLAGLFEAERFVEKIVTPQEA